MVNNLNEKMPSGKNIVKASNTYLIATASQITAIAIFFMIVVNQSFAARFDFEEFTFVECLAISFLLYILSAKSRLYSIHSQLLASSTDYLNIESFKMKTSSDVMRCFVKYLELKQTPPSKNNDEKVSNS